jgi:L-amino acid N-acyltransferase YncA
MVVTHVSEIWIRDARESDLPALLDIYNYIVRTSAATFDLEEQTLEQRRKWFQKFDERYPLIVAVVNGAVVGYASLSRFREKPAYGQTAETSVYIHYDYQGKGIGRLLMEAIIKRAKALNYHVLIAGITGGNESSAKLHRSLGFVPVAHFREIGYKFGQYHDVTFYQLFV